MTNEKERFLLRSNTKLVATEMSKMRHALQVLPPKVKNVKGMVLTAVFELSA